MCFSSNDDSGELYESTEWLPMAKSVWKVLKAAGLKPKHTLHYEYELEYIIIQLA